MGTMVVWSGSGGVMAFLWGRGFRSRFGFGGDGMPAGAIAISWDSCLIVFLGIDFLAFLFGLGAFWVLDAFPRLVPADGGADIKRFLRARAIVVKMKGLRE
jgi:hypothetical protein